MKGQVYFLLSILGILVGLFLVYAGLGQGLDPTLTLIVGLFVTGKEILDIVHGG